jgi:hypothetical protein
MSFFSNLFGSKPAAVVAEPPAPVSPTPAVKPQPSKSPLEMFAAGERPSSTLDFVKKYETQNPSLLNFAKTAAISLVKNNLTTVKANVVIVLDASGSMTSQYGSGAVQGVLDRVVPLATHFDPDGILECHAFACKTRQMPSITLTTIADYVKNVSLSRAGSGVGIGFSNDEPKVIHEVIANHKNETNGLPTYVIFISDGGVYKDAEITKLIRQASTENIFWQFVGLGGSNYGILEHLDTMSGRAVDNCNFFEVDSLSSITDEQLYDKLLTEFPNWIKDYQAYCNR